jgi:malonate transporter MadL subunit
VVIYGVALLALSMLLGLIIGQGIGWLIGVQANVGGVGIGMLALIAFSEFLKRHGRLNVVSQQGIVFWSSIYIPIVVAMAASQDVISAIQGGPVAILAGGIASLLCIAMVPVLDRLHRRQPDRLSESPEALGDE